MKFRDKYKWIGKYDEDIPEGWAIAFGEELCREIQEVYDKMTNEQKEEFEVLQIKEKYGTLRIYLHCAWPYFDEIHEIIRKYENLSWKHCMFCGKLATMCGADYIFPCCEVCNKEHNLNAVYKEFTK